MMINDGGCGPLGVARKEQCEHNAQSATESLSHKTVYVRNARQTTIGNIV